MVRLPHVADHYGHSLGIPFPILNLAASSVIWSCGIRADCGTAHTHTMDAEDIESNLESATSVANEPSSGSVDCMMWLLFVVSTTIPLDSPSIMCEKCVTRCSR